MLSTLLALALAAAPTPSKPAPDPNPFHWKVPGLVSTVEVPARMSVQGAPVRLQVYASRESVERLLQYFATAFDEAGFYLQRHQKRFVAQPHLTALDTRTFTSYTVLLEPEPGGITTVVLGEAKLGETASSDDAESLPVYPGAMNVLHGDFEGAKTLSYRVPAKEEAVLAWYRDGLTHVGFQEESAGVFRLDEREVRLSLAQDGGWVQVGIFVQTAPRDAAPPPTPTPSHARGAAGSHP